MSNSWILIETFGDAKPSVIGVGSSPKAFVPPRNVLRSTASRDEALLAVAEVLTAGAAVDRLSKDRFRRVLAAPLRTFAGRTHMVHGYGSTSATSLRLHETPRERGSSTLRRALQAVVTTYSTFTAFHKTSARPSVHSRARSPDLSPTVTRAKQWPRSCNQRRAPLTKRSGQ
uniref:GAF domain-containing protein n=1 Tax=unclassified Rhodococcus (in: high G+C Gram-positive bacteria) TaxID=192944 RepID=UPI0020CB6D0C|nr:MULTISPECIES: GAF domain-containing protein [unclassified Rhodococcus (in: high G+C Gram-positive bacteria)]